MTLRIGLISDTHGLLRPEALAALAGCDRIFVYAIHDLAELDIDPRAAGVRVVVSGPSHKPLVRERDGVLYMNPGSAGPRRFTLPIAVGELLVDGTSVAARIIELGV